MPWPDSTEWLPKPEPERRPVQPSDFERSWVGGYVGGTKDMWLYYRCPHCGQRDGPFRNMAHVKRVLKTTPRLCFYYNCPGGT